MKKKKNKKKKNVIKEKLGRLYLLPLDCLLRSTNCRDIEREYKAAKILCLYQTVLFIYIPLREN